MKLYMFPVAPNPTRVRLYLAEKAEAGTVLPVEQVAVSLPAGEQRKTEHLARNPRGALPVLGLDDGTYLTESLAIIEYLEDLYPEPPLIGTDPLQRARVRELERICEMAVLRPIAYSVHATNSPLGLAPRPAVAEWFRDGLHRTLDQLDARLSDGRAFVAGERPTIADCTLAAGLQFGRFGKIDLGGHRPHLGRWDAAYRERPPAQAVLVS